MLEASALYPERLYIERARATGVAALLVDEGFVAKVHMWCGLGN